MALLKPRNRKRWLHPYEVAYLLGLVRIKPNDSPERIKQAEESAMESLSRNAARWGISKIKRGPESGAGCIYPEESVLAYMERREREAQSQTSATDRPGA
jgi:hypothetical protein